MVEIQNIDDVIVKIEQMHQSLRMSDELFPLISDLFSFVKEIIPLMLEVNSFMQHSSKKIPTASENLSNVSKATELATNEVMDLLESISGKLDNLRTRVKGEGASEGSLKMIDAISTEANEITFSFQFQDITSQQLEHVNRILQAIYDKFISLFKSSMKLKEKSVLGKDVVEAMERELKNKNEAEGQDFHKKTADKMHQQGSISQDAIDQFFK